MLQSITFSRFPRRSTLSSSLMYQNDCANNICVWSSMADHFAIWRKWFRSLFHHLPLHSAILDGIESEERLIWSVRANCSSFENIFMILCIFCARRNDFCQTMRFSKYKAIISNSNLCTITINYDYFLVPRAGLEPASREAEDFETSVSTIPPSGQIRPNL